MRRLLIGGSGFIGKNLIRKFKADEASYLSRKPVKELDSLGYEHIIVDVTSPPEFEKIVENFDVIYYLAGSRYSDAGNFFKENVSGIKKLISALNKLDRSQKLIFLSSINADYGITEFYRSKRIGEANVLSMENSLVIRLSAVFGDGDHITSQIVRLARTKFHIFPGASNLSPIFVPDAVSAIVSMEALKGTYYLCSTEKISTVDAVNIIRRASGRSPMKEEMTKVEMNKLLLKLAEKGDLSYDELYDLSLNRFRETTVFDRFARRTKTYEAFLKEKFHSST